MKQRTITSNNNRCPVSNDYVPGASYPTKWRVRWENRKSGRNYLRCEFLGYSSQEPTPWEETRKLMDEIYVY